MSREEAAFNTAASSRTILFFANIPENTFDLIPGFLKIQNLPVQFYIAAEHTGKLMFNRSLHERFPVLCSSLTIIFRTDEKVQESVRLTCQDNTVDRIAQGAELLFIFCHDITLYILAPV